MGQMTPKYHNCTKLTVKRMTRLVVFTQRWRVDTIVLNFHVKLLIFILTADSFAFYIFNRWSHGLFSLMKTPTIVFVPKNWKYTQGRSSQKNSWALDENFNHIFWRTKFLFETQIVNTYMFL